MPKLLSELLAALPQGDVLHASGDVEITAPIVESDADVQPGGVFVARTGRSSDGHRFIGKAIERGAAAIVGLYEIAGLPVPYVQVRDSQAALGLLAAAYYDFPSRKLTVIGVTGTDGKTTTSTLIHGLLGKGAGLISTVAADLGDKTLDTGLHVTTPSAPEIQQYLAQMVANGLTYCVLEMTSHGLAQGRLSGVDIDVAVLTNVTHEHLDYHGSWEAYRDAKAIMFRMLSQSYRKPNQPKISVINADDPSVDFFAAIPADSVITYGLHENARFQAVNIVYHPHGTEFQIADNRSKGVGLMPIVFFTPLVGEFNVSNCLAAVETVFHCGGIASGLIQKRLTKIKGVPGRMERIDEGQNFTAIVDFAHTPNALRRVLEAARTMLPEGKRIIAVFGSAGLRDVEKRRMMAETSVQLADFTVLTAEDPRTESLDAILEMMVQGCISQGGIEGVTFIRVPDRGEAIYRACQMAQPGDIVMACGKGHEQSMCFGTIEYPWDDREAMRAALHGKPLRTLPTAT